MFLYPPRSLRGPGCGSNMIREVDPQLVWHFQWMTPMPSDNSYSSHTAPLDNVRHHQVVATACTHRRFVAVTQHLYHPTPLSPNASITQCLCTVLVSPFSSASTVLPLCHHITNCHPFVSMLLLPNNSVIRSVT